MSAAARPATVTYITPPIRYPLRLVASLTGYAITAVVLFWSATNRGLIASDVMIWDRVGDQVVAGVSPYSIDLPWQGLFFYAPPWALVFGITSWLPTAVQAALVFVVELAALRYVAGSWLRVGYLGLCPITGGEFANGSFNLVIAAAVAMALRGDGRAAGLAALAKFSPILAVRDVRRTAVTIALACAVTLPVLGWWRDWLDLLVYSQVHYSIGYPIPWLPRLAVAGLLVLSGKRWARGIAPFVAIPALYSYSIVLLYALMPAPRLRRSPDLDNRLAEGRATVEGVRSTRGSEAPLVGM